MPIQINNNIKKHGMQKITIFKKHGPDTGSRSLNARSSR